MTLFTKRCALALAVCLVVLVPSIGTPQPNVRIGGGALTANGQLMRNFQYVGGCPVQLRFDWGVISSEPVSVTYNFVRNDGGTSQPRNHYLPGGGRSVPIFDSWSLGANTPQFANYHGWIQLNIQAPMAVSQKIGFTLHCQ